MASLKLKEFLKRNKHSAQSPVKNHLHPFVLAAPKLYHSRRLVAEVTCSDARVEPCDYFGLRFGEALVIRNAGGRAVDAFRSLEVVGTIAPIGLIVVVHHTDCGAMFTTEEVIRSKLSHRAPADAASIKDKWFGTFRERNQEMGFFLPAEAQVVGYALDIETGAMREVASENP
ncbi:carbonic anhydrase [Fusarium sp. MPI-SDFR-AT-0072]|nr:carbonic anhydrase [Fusarium sp. MPI-SDFR-AT-0072]